MDPGIGKAAGGLVAAMRNHPMELALVVMNFALIGLFIEVQKEVQKLLSQCVIPPSTQRGDLGLGVFPFPTSETLPSIGSP
jgi:hypothetical protein